MVQRLPTPRAAFITKVHTEVICLPTDASIFFIAELYAVYKVFHYAQQNNLQIIICRDL